MVALQNFFTLLAPLSRATRGRGASRLVPQRPTSRRNIFDISLRQPSPVAKFSFGDGISSFMRTKESRDLFDGRSDVVLCELQSQEDVHSSQASPFMIDHAHRHSCAFGKVCGNETAYDERLYSLLDVVRAASVTSAEGVVAMQLSQLGNPAILARLSTCLTEMAWHLRHQGLGHRHRSAVAANNSKSQCVNQAFALDFDAFASGWRKLFRVRSVCELRELFDLMDADCDGFVSCKDISSAMKPSQINALARQCGEQSPIYQAALTEDEMLTYRDLIDRARSALDLAHQKGVKIVVATERAEWQPAVAHIVVFLQGVYNTGGHALVSHTG